MRTGFLVGSFVLSLVGTATAADPPVSVKSEDGPKPGVKKYHVTLDRAAAEKFRDALAGSDPKKVSEVLSAAATDPAQKVALALATNNVEAFRKKMAADGAIGPNGVEIVMTAHTSENETAPLIPGRVDTRPPGPIKERLRRAGRRAGEILLNPWSWEVKPRE
jgi:hypothetical protein